MDKNFNEVYCDLSGGGWTLISRFSNGDSKNWMRKSGDWWYDRTGCTGTCISPNDNRDMINQAFYLVKGSEFKITRSDDSTHTALLKTTSACLGGNSFRSKMASYGNFRHGTFWGPSSGGCRGSCSISFGGSYKSTYGFAHHSCTENSGTTKKIGFWCIDSPFQKDTGSVIKIPLRCKIVDADQGIGVTELAGKFDDTYATQNDFANDAVSSVPSSGSSYSLNLWVL